MNEVLIGQLSPGEIVELKKKCPNNLFSIEVNGHIAYFKTPTRHVLNYAMGLITPESKPLDYFENVAKEIMVGGSEEILTDDILFLNAVEQLKEVISFNAAKLVKL